MTKIEFTIKENIKMMNKIEKMFERIQSSTSLHYLKENEFIKFHHNYTMYVNSL